MIEQAKKALALDLAKATFDANNYFKSVKAGCYQVDSSIFYDIKQHPTLRTDYRKRVEMQEGAGPSELWASSNNYTCFRSVSKCHLEFVNGVVIVVDVQ